MKKSPMDLNNIWWKSNLQVQCKYWKQKRIKFTNTPREDNREFYKGAYKSYTKACSIKEN